MTPPKHAAIPLGPIETEDTGSILVSDTIRRLGRLEIQQNQQNIVLGQVAEGIENLTTVVKDIKEDVKNIGETFTAFRIETASYGSRLEGLELFQNRHDTMKIDDLEKARLKAEAVLEQDRIKAEAALEAKRKEGVDRRHRIMGMVGSGVVGIVVAAILSYLGLK